MATGSGSVPQTNAAARDNGTRGGDQKAAVQRHLRMIVRAGTLLGGLVFLVAVVIHPLRDGKHIAAASNMYEFTHGIEAIGLILQLVALAAIYSLAMPSLRSRDLPALYTALLGAIWYFGLIVVDGTRNPVTAKYAPSLVHTSGDMDISTGIIVLPALLLFPVGYILLGVMNARYGARSLGLLIGIGATIYTMGGLAIFGLGPTSPVIEILEIIGAVLFAIGFIMMGRFWTRSQEGGMRIVG